MILIRVYMICIYPCILHIYTNINATIGQKLNPLQYGGFHYITHPFSHVIYIVSLLGFYILTTFMVIAIWVPTVQSWRLDSPAPPRDQAAGAMTQYPTQSHYSDTDLANLS